MRILFISNYFPPHHIGGYEELCEEVAEGLKYRGHEVSVLTSRRGVSMAREDPGPIFRWLHSEIDYQAGQIPFQFLKGRVRRANDNIAALDKALFRWKPDIVMVWGMWNLSRDLLTHIDARESIPIVYYIADHWPLLPDAFALHWQEPARRWLTRWPKRLVGSVMRKVYGGRREVAPVSFDHALCVSADVRDHLRENGVKFRDVRVVHNGIHLSVGPTEALVKRRLPCHELRIVYAGRLSPDKGIPTVLNAMVMLQEAGLDVCLTIAGSGASWYEKQLHAQTHSLGISGRVSFLGRIERSLLSAVLSDSDVMVVPSIWPDPLPRIIQEGMDAGLVIVASEVGGIPEIIEDDVNGLMFPPGDANALAQQLQRLHDDPSVSARLAAEAARTVRIRFDIERTIQEVHEYLSGVVASPLIGSASGTSR